MGSSGQIRQDVDFAKSGLVELYETLRFKGFGLLRAIHKIPGSDVIFLHKLFEPRMPNVASPKNRDEEAREVDSPILRHYERSSSERLDSIFKRLKPIVSVTHVPVNPFAMLPFASCREEIIQHFQFKLVVMLINTVKQISTLSDQMD